MLRQGVLETETFYRDNNKFGTHLFLTVLRKTVVRKIGDHGKICWITTMLTEEREAENITG